MADNKAALATAIKAIVLAAKAEVDPANFDTAMTTYSTNMADAISTYSKALKATGNDSGGDTHDLDIG